MNRKDFQGLAALRLKEAKLLAKADCWAGAYYLAGYVVEFALKACIARKTQRYEFPDKKKVHDSHTHNIIELIRLAGFKETLAEMEESGLTANWRVVRDWNEESRYQDKSKLEAENLLAAIEDRSHGVLPWLKQRW